MRLIAMRQNLKESNVSELSGMEIVYAVTDAPSGKLINGRGLGGGSLN
jgi:hypothetical protein